MNYSTEQLRAMPLWKVARYYALHVVRQMGLKELESWPQREEDEFMRIESILRERCEEADRAKAEIAALKHEIAVLKSEFF